MESTSLKVSIIICTYNRSALLRKTLMAFMEMKDLYDVEIIVVDNNSTDNTKKVVIECADALKGFIDVYYHLEKNQGLSVARNTGFKLARYDIIAYLDDDAIPCNDWLNAMRKGFNHSRNIYAVGGKVEPWYEVEKPTWLTRDLEPLYSILDLGREVKEFPKKLHPIGANMAFRREILSSYSFPEHLGRKGNSLISHEETWIFSNVRKEMKGILYIPQMNVKHFIAKDRLNQTWLLNRYHADGISVGKSVTSKKQKFKVWLVALFKYIYLRLQSIILTDSSDKLLNTCRTLRQKGIFQSLKVEGG